jgi:hypothetical protein
VKTSELTNKYLIQEEIRSRLNSGNACYHSARNLLSSRLLWKDLKIRIYEIIILSLVLYGCETWSHILRAEQRLRVFENRVMTIFAPKKDEGTERWRNLLNEERCDLFSKCN